MENIACLELAGLKRRVPPKVAHFGLAPQRMGMLVTYRWIIERCSNTRFMPPAWKDTVSHSAMKKLPREGGHRSRQQARRNPRFSGELVMRNEDDAVVVLNRPAGLPAGSVNRSVISATPMDNSGPNGGRLSSYRQLTLWGK
jgi:hypothetical protein